MDPTIRESTEQQETQLLSCYAALSTQSKGRIAAEEKCLIRTEYARDRDRIVHSGAFRRLKHKAQVFFSPMGDHYRTRLTHTLEVAQIARTITRALLLNEDLVEAMAMGHDLGHTPFGHAGERALDQIAPFGFSHNHQSVRVVDKLERNGKGLNLTYEVKDGILHHSTGGQDACTLEGKVLEYADKIAYLNHDIDDAVRAGILAHQELPTLCVQVLGGSKSQRITTMIHGIVTASTGKSSIHLDQELYNAHNLLRRFMFERVYRHPAAMGEEQKVVSLLQGLYAYFQKQPERLPDHYRALLETEEVERVVCDYIAGMSDFFAVELYKSLFIPRSFSGTDVKRDLFQHHTEAAIYQC